MSAALLARLEAATGPDRGLDAELAAVLQLVPDFDPVKFIGPFRYIGTERGVVRIEALINAKKDEWILVHGREVPRYTESVDSALTLVPAGLPLSFGLRQTPETRPWVRLGSPLHGADTTASSLALALCIAALKARAP